ncbi:MAG: hypothetical protein KatS3mg040_0405 [Candidatus Kapaibacterium sp.]|jgi:hypothetical protein|nr:MAG: hypothetical protein KatS3mg040_0405 [Candidatus Kapabacteria bacterium]
MCSPWAVVAGGDVAALAGMLGSAAQITVIEEFKPNAMIVERCSVCRRRSAERAAFIFAWVVSTLLAPCDTVGNRSTNDGVRSAVR